MKTKDLIEVDERTTRDEPGGSELLRPLVAGRAAATAPLPAVPGVVVGELVAVTSDEHTPLVLYPGQAGSAAIPARSVVDLHGAHIGRPVILLFEGADPARPIVMGVLHEDASWLGVEHPDTVHVDVDGERIVVAAKEQVVLRCGRASITLTKAGKVLIEGTYVLSHSSGVNRIKGGAIQLN